MPDRSTHSPFHPFPPITQVIERTIRAALEVDWPADKLTVLLLDDGGAPGA